MRNPLIALLATTSLALAGCSQGTPGGQGVTTTPPHKPPVYGEADNTFNLSVPRMSTTLH